MSDGDTEGTANKGPSSPVRPAILLALALGVLAVAFYAVGGMRYVTGLFGGSGTGKGSPAASTPSVTPSTTTTKTAAPTSPAPPAVTPSAAGAALDPEARSRMFYEQIASRQTIAELAAGKFARFDLGKPVLSGADARIPVTATYGSGGSFSGTLLLKKYENAWYFAAIARDGNSLSVVKRNVALDLAVVDTVVSDQRDNQKLIGEIVAGTYDGLTLGSPQAGAGTTQIPITMQSSSGPEAGRIVLISKKIGKTTYWFITSFK